jgi:hypothetical protein
MTELHAHSEVGVRPRPASVAPIVAGRPGPAPGHRVSAPSCGLTIRTDADGGLVAHLPLGRAAPGRPRERGQAGGREARQDSLAGGIHRPAADGGNGPVPVDGEHEERAGDQRQAVPVVPAPLRGRQQDGRRVLATALYLPALRRYQAITRVALIGYTALTIAAYVAVAQGNVDLFGLSDKTCEALLIVLLVIEGRRGRATEARR